MENTAVQPVITDLPDGGTKVVLDYTNGDFDRQQNEVSDMQIMICEGLKDCTMVEPVKI